MSRVYGLAYRIGFTPWERAGRAGQQQLASLLDREERQRRAPFGRALDLGCGRGAHSMTLARRGWDVTGVDAVPRAIEAARERAAREGLTVDFLCCDVTALSPPAVGREFGFLLDIGCFHGLTDDQRLAMGESVNAVAAPDATLLLLAFRSGRPRPLPRGADRADIERAFLGWTVVDDVPAETAGLPGPLKRAAPRCYRLRRN